MINTYMLLVEIKYFNALNHNKQFFDQPLTNKQEAYEELFGVSRNDYTTGNVLDICTIKNVINLLV